MPSSSSGVRPPSLTSEDFSDPAKRVAIARPTEVTGSARPNLLFLCQTVPYPPDGGVNIRTYNVLRLLAKKYEVVALCFYRVSDHRGYTDRTSAEVEASIAGLRKIVNVEAFPIPQERSRIRLILDHARSVVSRRAYTKYMYQSAAFRSRLKAVLRQREFHVAHVDSLDLCSFLPDLTPLPVVCVHHNVESQLLAQRSRAETSRWRRSYMRYQARLLEGEERRWCPRVALNVVVSAADRERLMQIAPAARFTIVPNGVDTEWFRPGVGRNDSVVFIGGSNWFPNRDARDYFAADILPKLRAIGCDMPIKWVGHASTADQTRFRDQFGIELTGYVQDAKPYFRDAACFVVPLRVGGGTRLKILDAWAMGKAVVSTSIGCEGLEAVDGENILIRDTAEGFANAVRAVCRERALREKLGEKARETAERIYSWGAVGREMLTTYDALASSSVTWKGVAR